MKPHGSESRPVKVALPLLLMALLGSSDAPAQAGSVDRGRVLARRLCAGCHAIGATGTSRHRDAPAFRAIAQRQPIDLLEENFTLGIVTAHSDMPHFRLSERDIADLLALIASYRKE
jgi:cytochrome c